MLTALSGRAPPLRTLPPAALDLPRRAGFDGGIIRLPESYRGVTGAAAKELTAPRWRTSSRIFGSRRRNCRSAA